MLVAVGGRRHGGEESAEPVDRQDDRPARRRRRALAAAPARRRRARTRRLRRSASWTPITPPHDGSTRDVGEPTVTAGVDDVAVRLAAAGDEERAQRRRRARAERPDQRQVALAGHPAQRHLALTRGIVDQADDTVAERGDDRRVEPFGQRRQPRPERRVDLAQRRRGADRAGERRQLARSFGRSGGRSDVRRCGSPDVARRRTRRLPSPTGRNGPELCAAWNTTVSPAPRRSIARPGLPREKPAASAAPTMSTASARSCSRKAMRRLVFARISSLTTPAGRCVASTRWMPRLRPRWATPTSDVRNPGSSVASAANSSITTTSLGNGAVSRRRLVRIDVVDAGSPQQPLAAAQLGFEADQRPLGEAVVEVGDDAHRVRQVGAGVERRPALVVDEDEREVVRDCCRPPGQRPACAATRSCPRRWCRRRGRAARRRRGRSRRSRLRWRRSRHGARAAIAARRSVVHAPSGGDGDRVVDRRAAAAGEHRGQRHGRRAGSRRVGRVLRVVQAGEPAGGAVGDGDGEPGGVNRARPRRRATSAVQRPVQRLPMRSSLRHSGGTTPPAGTMATTATDGAAAR